ncbi:hypothetical protein BC833DRAFT_579755 [Globomyces pollinis-pini]|nr:hypothetical protein BC833DRAFT_579755 [Globomyces pollinis-pini]
MQYHKSRQHLTAQSFKLKPYDYDPQIFRLMLIVNPKYMNTYRLGPESQSHEKKSSHLNPQSFCINTEFYRFLSHCNKSIMVLNSYSFTESPQSSTSDTLDYQTPYYQNNNFNSLTDLLLKCPYRSVDEILIDVLKPTCFNTQSQIPYVPLSNQNDKFHTSTPFYPQIEHHTVIKRYFCSFDGCRKGYTRACSLKKHIKTIHENLKPFECEYKDCEQKFARKHDLKRHLQTHTGERTFGCRHCPKRFSRKDHLQTHLKSLACL